MFRITTSGAETVLYSFGASGIEDSSRPIAGLVQGSDGNLYGTSLTGGASNAGTVFRITTSGVETVLHSFTGNCEFTGNVDGAEVYAPLVEGSDGNFYGTTYAGGRYGEGTVFKVTPGGVETLLYSFGGDGGIVGSADGAQPWAGLIPGPDGSIYGTTIAGAAYNEGIVFNLANVILAQ